MRERDKIKCLHLVNLGKGSMEFFCTVLAIFYLKSEIIAN